MIKKAELIERMKAGEKLTRLYGWNKPDTFYLSERVHAGAAKGLIRERLITVVERTAASSVYKWKGD